MHWAKKYLHHEDKEIRREICHRKELRGRKYPQDILPLLIEASRKSTGSLRRNIKIDNLNNYIVAKYEKRSDH